LQSRKRSAREGASFFAFRAQRNDVVELRVIDIRGIDFEERIAGYMRSPGFII
jgi:hypothetical protein